VQRPDPAVPHHGGQPDISPTVVTSRLIAVARSIDALESAVADA
jgi:hypothetical protein